MRTLFWVVVLACLASFTLAGCSNDNSSSSSVTTTTPSTPTGPVTDKFASIIYPQDVITHSFSASTAGTVTVQLTNAGPPADVTLGLGIGVPNPNAPGCSLLTAVNTAAGAAPQLTATVDIGTFCVSLFDIGNAIPAGESFSITIVHP